MVGLWPRAPHHDSYNNDDITSFTWPYAKGQNWVHYNRVKILSKNMSRWYTFDIFPRSNFPQQISQG